LTSDLGLRCYQDKSNNGKAIGRSLGLSEDEELKLERQSTDFNNNTHSRYQQFYQGIPVWGMRTVVSRNPNSEVIRLHGEMVLDTYQDRKKQEPFQPLPF
jgi:Zn-dependent metalloprotease